MDNNQYKIQLQRIANEYQVKVYLYLLCNGNSFSTVEPMLKSEMIGGSKIDKLIEVIKPISLKGAE